MENNIGILNEIFLQNINDILKRKDGHKIIKEYALLFKKNKNLIKEYIVFENIVKIKNNENIKDYIIENINYLENIDKKTLKSLNDKVLNFIIENKIEKIDEIENENIFEEIHNLIFMKKNVKTINERVDKINNIVKYITENKNNETEDDEDEMYDLPITENIDLLLMLSINNFNKKYKNSLTEEEKNIFKQLTSERSIEEKESFFEENRKKCLESTNIFLNENIDTETKEKLLNVKEKLTEQKFNEKEYINDVLSFIELNKTLSE